MRPRLAFVRILAGALLALLLGTWALAAASFPTLTGRVVDDARVLSPQVQADLTGKLADLEAKTGRQLVVVTVPSLQGQDIEGYGYQLGRAWGIGEKGRDTGVLLIVAPNERQVRVEVGYGLEPVLTDALSSVILQQRVLPKFRAGDIAGGVVDGTGALIDQLSLPDDQARARAAAPPPVQPSSANPFPAIVVVVLILWVVVGLLKTGGGRHGSSLWILPLLLLSGSGHGRRGGGSFGGGFSGGGGSFGGGGASGRW
jgi:uncharacterized protein